MRVREKEYERESHIKNFQSNKMNDTILHDDI